MSGIGWSLLTRISIQSSPEDASMPCVVTFVSAVSDAVSDAFSVPLLLSVSLASTDDTVCRSFVSSSMDSACKVSLELSAVFEVSITLLCCVPTVFNFPSSSIPFWAAGIAYLQTSTNPRIRINVRIIFLKILRFFRLFRLIFLRFPIVFSFFRILPSF